MTGTERHTAASSGTAIAAEIAARARAAVIRKAQDLPYDYDADEVDRMAAVES